MYPHIDPIMSPNAQRQPTHIPTQLGSGPQRQQGVVLFVALIALVAMTLAAIALVRSTDTANVIAGNAAFKQSTLNAADVGFEIAFAALPNIIATSSEQDIPNQYFALQQTATDSSGVPLSINWNNVTCYDTTGATLSNCNNSSTYRIQYVIDRLCTGTLPVTDTAGKCVTDTPLGGGSKKSGGVVFSSSTRIYYRVTVRVTGPRNSSSMIQALIGR